MKQKRYLHDNMVAGLLRISLCDSIWPRATSLASRMQLKTLRKDVITLGASIRACDRSWNVAVQQLSDCRGHMLEANLITYNATSTSCAKSSDWQRALQLLSGLKQTHAHPDTVTWNSMCDACEKGAVWLQALCLLAQARRGPISTDALRCFNYCNSTSLAFLGLLGFLRRQLKIEILATLLRAAKDVITLSSIVSSAGRGYAWRQAVQLASGTLGTTYGP